MEKTLGDLLKIVDGLPPDTLLRIDGEPTSFKIVSIDIDGPTSDGKKIVVLCPHPTLNA